MGTSRSRSRTGGAGRGARFTFTVPIAEEAPAAAIAKALDTGAADYIVKPFSPTELVARVRAALRGRAGYEGAGVRTPVAYAPP